VTTDRDLAGTRDRASFRSLRWWIAGTVAVALAATFWVWPRATRPPTSGSDHGFYAANSPVNLPIPPNPVLDPNDSAWRAHVVQSRLYLNTFRYGMAVVYGDGSERRFQVRTAHDADWGSAFGPYTVPLKKEWRATTGSDGWLCVVEADRSRGYWLWQYSWNGGAPTASWGGTGRYDKETVNPWADHGTGVGAGIVPPALTIRKEDLDRGYINHALALADPWTASSWKYPANKSDGLDRGLSPIPEGQRIRLDPSINVDATSWPRFEKMVAKALQKYGAYMTDTSDGSFGLSGQMDQAQRGENPGQMWAAVGVTREYQSFDHIQLTKLQFLRNWDGS
jgi:hypothetical protein